MSLDERVSCDERAAQAAIEGAAPSVRARAGSAETLDGRHGLTDPQKERQAWQNDRRRSIAAIADHPFHAMMEVMTEVRGPNGATEEKEQIWYAHEDIDTNEPLGACR